MGYLGSCNMLPPKLASEICSLTPGQDRLTVSVVFQVHPHTGVVYEDETWIGKSIIQSAGKLTYKDVDAIVSGHTDIKIEGAEIKDIHILHVRT
jgi:protein SSD1